MITYLACGVTVVALMIDPFTQQIIHYSQEMKPVNGVRSSVTRSQVYDNGSKGVNGVAAVVGK